MIGRDRRDFHACWGEETPRRFGVEILAPQRVVGIRVEGPYRFLKLADGAEISCNALLVAMGVQWRTLDVPGIDRLQGAGVYYGGGTSEAIACRGETVYIIGGANSAGQAAMHFSKYAEKVVMLVRGESLAGTMSRYLIEQIENTPTIEVWTKSTLVGVKRDTRQFRHSVSSIGISPEERVLLSSHAESRLTEPINPIIRAYGQKEKR